MNVSVLFTLADVMNTLRGADLPEKRRRELLSAGNAAEKLLHRNLWELPADMATLRERLAPIHHVHAGISAKRLANIKADLATALRIFDRVRFPPRPKLERSDAWMQFVNSLEEAWQRHMLGRLADCCSSIGVAPEAVDDQVLAQFRSHLSDGSLVKNPHKTWKRTIQTWNGCVRRAGLPLKMLTVPRAPRYLAIPLSDFPPSFQADLDTWIARQAHVDLFADEGPKKALRPTSLRNVRAIVRQFASALVARSRPIESITSLATLVELNTFKEGLRFFIDRNGGKPPTGLWGTAGALLAIARYHVKLAEADIKALATIRGRLKLETDRVTDKNKRRLGQFDDLYNVELLMLLPRRLVDDALKRQRQLSRRLADNPLKRQRQSPRVALDVMRAVAIEILLVCPMRMNNLAGIDIERHFRWRGTGNGQTVSLYIPAAETKNGVAIEADFPRDTTILIRLYLKSYRELVSTTPGNWLFPLATGGGHRGPDHLSQEVSATIGRETGLEVNGHLFRHLAGKLYLERRPGGHETVRQFLRHKKIDTTTSFYTGLDSRRAGQQYFDVVLSGRTQRGPKPRRTQRGPKP